MEELAKFRQSVFDVLDDDGNPLNLHGKKTNREYSSRARSTSTSSSTTGNVAPINRRHEFTDAEKAGLGEFAHIISAPRVRKEVAHFNISAEYNYSSKRPPGSGAA